MNTIFLALIGAWVGLLIVPLCFIGVSILFIKQLSDEPEKPKKPYLYTAIEPGRIKAVLRGGRVIKYMMNYQGHYFPWDKNNDHSISNDDQWDVKKGEEQPERYERFNFLYYFFLFIPSNFLRVFSWSVGVVNRFTGHRFVGLWPFQVLYLYRFTRKVQKLDETGRPMSDEHGNPILEDSSEMTDHVRARTFVRQSSGQEIETREGLKVKVTWVADVYTTNPQKALFGSDRWDVVLDSTIIRELASTTRTLPINEILTAEDEATRDELSQAVLKEANKKLKKVGLKLDTFNIIDFEDNLSEDEKKALTAPWRAEQNKKAAKTEGEGRGEGRAAEITRVAKAIAEGGEAAQRAQELEAQIATAEAVGKGGGVAIFGTQNAADGTQAAILAELRKKSKGE